MTSTEDRLRAALAGKASSVTYGDLRNPHPPQALPRGTVRRGVRPAALLALTAVLVAAALLLPRLLADGPHPSPATPPSLPVAPTVPIPSPSPSAKVPEPVEPARPTPTSPAPSAKES
ncbi:hypothetical protein AB0O67_09100 [Streptomyces sp. NPDC086077]|uniref:hypothetical protein n=1 Tax=Streptomyces sp. NPDC086077 TaxID=3154862 RepID=UPI00343E4E8C